MVEGIIIGFILFIMTSITAYIFKIKQLYVSSRKLYGESALSEKGSLSEIVIANHGNQVEEDIKVILSPDIKCELIASSSANVQVLSENIIILDRLHAKSQISLLLLIEKDELKNSEIIEITSSSHKGKIIDTITTIPPNFGQIAIFIFALISFIIALFYMPKIYDVIEQSFIEEEYATIINEGWENIGRYTSSDLAENYSKQEFPIRYIDQNITDKIITLTFEVINKSSTPIEITLSTNEEFQILQKPYISKARIIALNYTDAVIAPLAKQSLVLLVKKKDNLEIVQVKLSIKHGEEFIYDITKKIKVKELL